MWVVRKFWFGENAFREVYLVGLFGLLLHIAFDLVTSYGTMVFSLFPNYRAYFDVMFIIDPFLDLICWEDWYWVGSLRVFEGINGAPVP